MFYRRTELEKNIQQHNGNYLFQVIISVVVISMVLSQMTDFWLDESLIIDKEIERVHVKLLFLYGFPVLGLGLLLSGFFSGQSVVYQKISILVMMSIVATIHTLSISMFSDISIISLMMITLVAKLLVFPPTFSLLVYTIYILQANMMVEIFHSGMVLYADYYFSLGAMYVWLNYISINNYRCYVRDYYHEQKKKSWMAKTVIRNREVAAKNIILNGYSYIDEVTGLHNRRYLQEHMASLNQGTKQQPLGVLLIDIDHFKQVNDVYGHAKGDEYLKQVSQTLRNVFKRKSDVIARYGGEEIVVMLTGISKADLEERARQACEAVRAQALKHPLRDFVSVSIGGIHARAGFHPAEQYLDEADACMYQVKSSGRNGYLVESS
ncbi:GGDEF domain-containing protein [Photobacterium rosenbergii]|uniref:diguanylate cyclase n=1 Tax=Photobacterium rosenbergii TaxID=294936 RepID=A0ABU3ZF28_9GAMM|nr:GGDEF domain-containing protein [Photobacterium rosenbergii]MDV5168704.1 GGDEF domain-containing protein [Photobacterium rosenbergii]